MKGKGFRQVTHNHAAIIVFEVALFALLLLYLGIYGSFEVFKFGYELHIRGFVREKCAVHFEELPQLVRFPTFAGVNPKFGKFGVRSQFSNDSPASIFVVFVRDKGNTYLFTVY